MVSRVRACASPPDTALDQLRVVILQEIEGIHRTPQVAAFEQFRLRGLGQPLWQDDEDLAADRYFNPTDPQRVIEDSGT